MYAYSVYYRRRLEEAGLGRTGLRTRADLTRLAPTELALVDEPGALVLRPDFRSITRHGSRYLTVRAAVARLLGTVRRFNRVVVEPRFKPIHWVLSSGVPLGLTAADLRRLGALGARWFTLAGVGTGDVVVNLLSADLVAYWALVQGARQIRVPCVQAGASADAATLARLVPSVLVGSVADLTKTLPLETVRTVLVVGEPLPPSTRDLDGLRALAPHATVVPAWVPAGTRAVWTACRQDSAGGTYHTSGPVEVLEVDGPRDTGELIWSGIGWGGSVLLRVRTGAMVERRAGPCRGCGRPDPLVVPAGDPGSWPVAAALGREAAVRAWEVERRVVDGAGELIVTLVVAPPADPAELVRRLDATLHATQYVILDPADFEARRATMAR